LLDGVAGCFLNAAQHVPLARRHEQDGNTGSAGPASTTDTVHIGFGVIGNIVVYDMADPLYVDTTGGNVGRDNNVQLAVLKPINRPLTQLLVHIAVKGGSGKAPRFQFFGQLCSRLFGSSEYDHAVEVFGFQNSGERIQLLVVADKAHALLDGFDRAGFGLDLDFRWIAQVATGNVANRSRHGSREQGQLAFAGRVVENPLDIVH